MRNNLKKLRVELGISGTELAQLVGVSHSMIYMIENGKKKPSIILANKISKVLGKNIEEIFFENDCNDKLLKNKETYNNNNF